MACAPTRSSRSTSRKQDHPDRQLVLCRRDEEVGVHHAQLLSAGAGRDADALLGQCRQGRRRRAVLRSLRHRQDHAVGRSQPHPDRRRRARLGSGRRVQFRGRLLRQVHQALARRPSPRSTPPPTASARCWRTWCSIRRRAFRDFDDDTKTENTRSAYPLDFMPNASRTGRAGHPKNIIFLTADAYGVMPPIAKLTPAQAMYHFLSGYTAKVAGTEKGLVGVEPEFSTCFARAVPAAPAGGIRQPAARADRQAQGRLLAGELRLDRRHLRRRPPHADQGDARAA